MKIMMLGGDNTSDRFGAALASKVLEKCPQATMFGVGGPLMNDAGVRLLYDISEQVSLGIVMAMRGSPVVKRLIKLVADAMEREQPALVLHIGLPIFGYKLLEIARAKGIPVLYYYTPLSRGLGSVRVGEFSKVVSKVASISRFETAQCEAAGIDCEFVGHPLMDLADFTSNPAEARAKLGIVSDQTKVIAVLPGAREIEVKSVLPNVLKALDVAASQHDDMQVIVSMASTIRSSLVDEIVERCSAKAVRLERDSYDVLRSADLAITSIGTSSLEASLLGIPSLAVYRVPQSTYFVDKLLDRKPTMTITNNILRKTVIPEFIQRDFSPSKMAETVERLLYDEQARQNMVDEFVNLEHELGAPGSVSRTADLVVEMAGCDSDESASS
jgi:lipid-A-disaccharide synthase